MMGNITGQNKALCNKNNMKPPQFTGGFLYPIIMDYKDLPFKIGMQYENWEFDLEPIEFAQYYDKYEYIKNDIPFVLAEKGEHIYLYFKLDILFRIEIVFKSKPQRYLLD